MATDNNNNSNLAGRIGGGGVGLPTGPNPSIATNVAQISNPGPNTTAHVTNLHPTIMHSTPASSHFQVQPQLQSQTQSQLASTPPQPGVPTPSNPKRGQQKPPVRPMGATSLTGNPQSSPFKPTELAPAPRRKKRKAPEKQVPDRVAALLPESALYTQLLEFEARVDAALARKKTDIQEALKNPPSLQRTLRIYVFNTFANQNHHARVTDDKQHMLEQPSWTLRILGRILEDGIETDASASAGTIPKQQSSSFPKFSSFFKRITVNLDPSLYPDNPVIIWDNVRSPTPVEGFEIKRKGSKEFTASIRLEMNYVPEKFKLSPSLTELLGIEVDTRPRIIAALWQYVKAKKLQHPSDPSVINCDPPLQRIFGGEKIKFSFISQKLSQHLYPPQPIHLEHKIRLSGNSPVGHACYDVLVDVPFPLQKEMSAFLANIEKHKDIDACDEAICGAIKKIHEHRRRRAFYLCFSQSPVEFINALIASQSRDLKLVAGEASRNAEKEGRSDFYNQPWVEDAIIRYLNRKPAAGNEPPGTTSNQQEHGIHAWMSGKEKKYRKGWLILIHDLSGTPVVAASTVTPFVPSHGTDHVSRSNPGAWLILRPGSCGGNSWFPLGHLEAWRERGRKGEISCNFKVMEEGGRFNGIGNTISLSRTVINCPKGNGDKVNINMELPIPGGFVMSVTTFNGEHNGKGKCSKLEVQLAMRHVTCLEDAAVFMALAAAVDLSVDACQPFSRRLTKDLGLSCSLL